MAGVEGVERVETSVVDEGGAYIPSVVAIAGEHWNALAVGDVRDAELLRTSGKGEVGESG